MLKANDDLVALIKVRINEHELQQAELKRQEEEKAQQLAAQQRQKAAEPVVEQPVKAPQEPELVAATPINKTTAATQQPVDDGQRIKLGDISTRLGFTLSAEFLRSLGFEAVERKQGAQLYRASDFPRTHLAAPLNWPSAPMVLAAPTWTKSSVSSPTTMPSS